MLFTSFPYDYPLLWTSSPTPAEYYAQLEMHLKFLHASPPLIPRILHIIIAVGFMGLFIKLFKPTEANLLFDGASLVLYLVGVVVYIANIVKGLRMVTAGAYGDPSQAQPGEVIIGREDSLRVLSASNTILALVLVGVLVLQAGQWYAESKEQDEVAEFEKEQEERHAHKKEKNGGHMTRSAAKKKQ